MNIFSSDGTVASTLTITDMPTNYDSGYVWFEFFSSAVLTAANLVTPSAGTVDVEASENGTKFGEVSLSLDISTDAYIRPNFAGSIKSVKVTPTAITGATHYRANVSRFSTGPEKGHVL